MPALYQLELDYMTIGIEVDLTSQRVASAAPIAKWMVGKTFREVCHWTANKKGIVRLVKMYRAPHEQQEEDQEHE